MEILHETFDFDATLKQLDKVLASDGDSVKKYSHVPTLEEIGDLDYFIANCTVVYAKVRIKTTLSSALEGKAITFRQRECFHRIVTSLLQEHPNSVDFIMHDDEIACIVNTPFQTDIYSLFEQMAKVNSMLSILSKKSQQLGMGTLGWGIGAHYGETYVSVQRYHDGSPSFNWSGYTYNYARFLCDKAIENSNRAIMTSDVFYRNLKDEYKEMMREEEGNLYSANVINRPMSDWQTQNLDNK